MSIVSATVPKLLKSRMWLKDMAGSPKTRLWSFVSFPSTGLSAACVLLVIATRDGVGCLTAKELTSLIRGEVRDAFDRTPACTVSMKCSR